MRARTAGILPVLLLAAALAGGETQTLPLFAPADDAVRQGFARVVNLSNRSGTVSVRAYDDAGVLRRTSASPRRRCITSTQATWRTAAPPKVSPVSATVPVTGISCWTAIWQSR